MVSQRGGGGVESAGWDKIPNDFFMAPLTYWLSLALCCWAFRRLSDEVTEVDVTKANTKLQFSYYYIANSNTL